MEIKEYWNLIGQGPLLAITWELEFSQACGFHRMYHKNHKNFHFTQIWDKTNATIFLKVQKQFLTMFGHFCPNGDFFQKNPVLSHNYKWAPKTMLSFRKKPMNQSRENFRTDRRRDRRMEGWTDRQTCLIGPFRPRLGIQKLYPMHSSLSFSLSPS